VSARRSGRRNTRKRRREGRGVWGRRRGGGGRGRGGANFTERIIDLAAISGP